MLPDFLTDPHIETGALVPLLEEHEPPPVAIYVVRPPAPNVSRKVAALIEVMLEIDCDA